MLQIPVQHAKTTYGSQYNAAWTLGNFPEKFVLAVSYNQSVAQDKIGRPARGVMERCGPDVFGVQVDPRSKAVNRWDLLDHAGGFWCTSINSGLASRRVDLGIIDDPIGQRSDFDTKRKRDEQWNWYREEYRTRLAPGAATIFIMSRWDTDDLVGRVIQDAVDRNVPIRVIDLPAICPPEYGPESEGPISAARRKSARDRGVQEPPPEPYVDALGRVPGEALWPEVRDIDFLTDLRASMGARQYGAQLQGRPRILEGQFFKESWFRTYLIAGKNFVVEDEVDGLWRTRQVPWEQCIWMQYVDLATSLRQAADYFVVNTVAINPGPKEIFEVNVLRDKIAGPDQIPTLVSQYLAWKPRRVKIESVGYQLSTVQAAVRAGLPAVPITRTMDKLSRANYIATRYEAGAVFHPRFAPWKAEFEDELINFPRGHDDQVDTIADAGADLLDDEMFSQYEAAGGLYIPR